MPDMNKQFQFWAVGFAVLSVCLFALTWLPSPRAIVVFPLDTSHSSNNQLTIDYPLAVRKGEHTAFIVKVVKPPSEQDMVVRAHWDVRNAAIQPQGEVYAPLANGKATITWHITPSQSAEGTFWLSLINNQQEEPILARQFEFPIQTYFSFSAQTLRIMTVIGLVLSLVALALLRRQI